jgi:hypothetical protein
MHAASFKQFQAHAHALLHTLLQHVQHVHRQSPSSLSLSLSRDGSKSHLDTELQRSVIPGPILAAAEAAALDVLLPIPVCGVGVVKRRFG